MPVGGPAGSLPVSPGAGFPTSPEMAALDRLTRGESPLVFALALPVASALAQAPAEFAHYRAWLDLGRDETALRFVVASVLLGKTLVAVGGLSLVLCLLARGGSETRVRVASALGTLLLLGFVALDLEVKRRTGNPLAVYLPFAFEAETLVWAGVGFDPGPAILRASGGLGLVLGTGALAALGLERWARGGSAVRVRRLRLVVLALLAGVPLIGLAAARTAPRAVVGELRDDVPGIGSMLLFRSEAGEGESSALRAARAAIDARYATEVSRWREVPEPVVLPPEAVTSGHDVLLVVVESLRADALESRTMPFLHTWAKRGLRLDRHSSTSNASHYGLFALLYGRSPLRYFETLEGGEPPTLIEALRRAGYERHLVTCAELDWRGMARFMGPPHFELERLQGEGLADCDRAVVARASHLLAEGDRPPRLVLAFLMSTHFGFHHPAAMAPFQPALSPPNASTLDPRRDREALHNRYRNSAFYVDTLLRELLSPVDPARTVVVVTGDHGEALYEDGTLAHASRLSDVQTRVPFVLTGPGVGAGRVRTTPTDHADVPRTLLARLGWPGEAVDALPGRDLERGPDRAFAALVHAKARASEVDRVVLASAADRFALRLDGARGRARFSGRLGRDGRLDRRAVTNEEASRLVDWFDGYLAELGSGTTSPSTPIE